LKVRSPENVFVVTDAKLTLENPAGVKVLKIPMATPEDFMMEELFQAFKDHGITSVMLEGGAQTYGAFFNARKVRRLHVYIAPMLLGSRSGLSWSHAFGGESMKERIDLKRVERQTFGADEYWTARV
jgi:diaminohydroxyphosphoribosylaminopyrimidine deaminase/5-amino-6-(5-phosphoribosylamino)uracil reductase